MPAPHLLCQRVHQRVIARQPRSNRALEGMRGRFVEQHRPHARIPLQPQAAHFLIGGGKLKLSRSLLPQIRRKFGQRRCLEAIKPRAFRRAHGEHPRPRLFQGGYLLQNRLGPALAVRDQQPIVAMPVDDELISFDSRMQKIIRRNDMIGQLIVRKRLGHALTIQKASARPLRLRLIEHRRIHGVNAA